MTLLPNLLDLSLSCLLIKGDTQICQSVQGQCLRLETFLWIPSDHGGQAPSDMAHVSSSWVVLL